MARLRASIVWRQRSAAATVPAGAVSVDQVALDLLTTSIDHDEWFRREVEKGRVSARESRLLNHDEVASKMDQRYRR